MRSNIARHLERMRRTMPQLKAKIASQVIAVEAAQFHDENFQSNAWTETGKPWRSRKNNKDSGRSVLVKSGRLRRAATTPRTRNNVVDFILPIYGKVHNEGGRAGRGNGFKMPKRQFAGQSRILKQRFKRKSKNIINQHLNRI